MRKNNRRSFIKRLTATVGTFSLAGLSGQAEAEATRDLQNQLKALPEDAAVTNEKLWQQVKQSFTVSSNILYLNSAGLCPQPKVVQETVERYNRMVNDAPTYYMNRVLNADIAIVRQKLAELAGCATDEIAIQANAIMSMYHIIFGMEFKPGDEVILTKQDYSSVKVAYEQLAQRSKVKLVWLDLDLVNDNKATIIQKFARAVTPRTKLMHITHMINWTGLILPVKEICAIARKKNIVTLVDGAQTFAQLNFKVPDLGCDFFATSLHKWLCAPTGTGMLYARKEKMPLVYPLYGSPNPTNDNINKFEHVGTIMKSAQLGVSAAVDFHYQIGSALKEKRLQYLKNYWIDGIKHLPGIKINTPVGASYSCAVAHFSSDKIDSKTLVNNFFRKHRIHVLKVNLEQLQGIRVSPNIFTTTRDLDRFITAVQRMTNK